MAINRRALLRALGPTLAFPFLLRSEPAHAALTIKKLGNPIQLGASQPGGQSRVALSAFNDGSYVAGWINTRSNTDARAFVQKRRRNGTALSPEIQMGGGPLTDGIFAINIATVALPNGTSLIFFAAERNGASSSDALDIFVQRMSASFTKVGGPIPVNTTLAGSQDAVLATLLKDGNVQVVWSSSASSTIRGRIISPNGQPLTPERTVIRDTTGINTPRALGPGPNGEAVLSYTRIASGAGAARAESTLSKKLQRIRNNVVFGPERTLDTATASRPMGAIGLSSKNLAEPDDMAYFNKYDADGNVTEVHRVNLNWGATPQDNVITNRRVEPGYQGAPQVALIDIGGVRYAVLFVRTEAVDMRNTLTVLLLRLGNPALVHSMTLVFDNTFLNCDSAIGLRVPVMDAAECAVGYSKGNTFLDEIAVVQRFFLGEP